jgi:hypothetical protein
MTATIAPAVAADLPAIASLLTASGLPSDGIADHMAMVRDVEHATRPRR